MRFKSLEQAYFLYNYKRVVFRQLSAEGVPFLWHEYKKLRDGGMDAKTAEKAVHDPRIEKGSAGVNWSWMKEATLETIQGSEEIHLIPTFVHKILKKYIAIASRESKIGGIKTGKGVPDARRGLDINTNKGLIKFNTIIGKILKGQGYTKFRQSREGKKYTSYSIQKWQQIVKSPYMNHIETGTMVGDIRYPKSGGTETNPIVFIRDPTPLKNEKWDNRYLKSDKFQGHKNKNFLEFDDIEVSSYGRVKKNGKVLKPKKTEYGLKTNVTGEKIRFFKDEGGWKSERTGEKGSAQITYGVSLQMLQNLNETIPENASLLVEGKFVSRYGNWKDVKKWQDVLKIRRNSITLQRRRYTRSKPMQQDTATVGGSCCESIRHKLIGMVQEWEEDWLHMKFSEDYADMNCEELMDALKDLEDALRPERPNLSVDISDLIDEWIECEEDGN